MREIIEIQGAGNSGPHQSGFERYALATFDCGHRVRVSYWLVGDTDGHLRCTESNEPNVGDTWARCPHCGKEALHTSSARKDARTLAEDARNGTSPWPFSVKALMDGPVYFSLAVGEGDQLLAFWPQ